MKCYKYIRLDPYDVVFHLYNSLAAYARYEGFLRGYNEHYKLIWQHRRVGRTPWAGDQLVARPIPVHKHRKTRTHINTKHPCPVWDLNPRSWLPSGYRGRPYLPLWKVITSSRPFTSTLNMEAAFSPETLMFTYKIMPCHSPQDHTCNSDGLCEWCRTDKLFCWSELCPYIVPLIKNITIYNAKREHHEKVMTFRKTELFPDLCAVPFIAYITGGLFVWSEGCAQCLFLLGKQICCGQANAFCIRRQLWQ
jgi:hypothetical protein